MARLNKKTKSYLRFIVKFLITGAALYFVFQKIDVTSFWLNIRQANIWLLVLALAFFNISKLISAERLLIFYRLAGLVLERTLNFLLYYVGMFYNLFLPGAVGGDAYKVFWLKQSSQQTSTRRLISATLLDRLSGLALLTFLALGGLMLTEVYEHWEDWWRYIIFILWILTIPAWYGFLYLFFRDYIKGFWPTSSLSLGVQGMQLIASAFILWAIAAEGILVDYLTLFLFSSAVAVLPFTIGGVGARELVFLYGYSWLNIQEADAISFTILFFVITAVSSLAGLYFSFTVDRRKSQELDAPRVSDN